MAANLVLDNSNFSGNPPVLENVLVAAGLMVGSVGVSSGGAVVANGSVTGTVVQAKNTLQVRATAPFADAGQNTAYNWDNTGTSAGGLSENHLQLWGYFNALTTPQTIQEFADVYPCPVGGTAPAGTTNSCFRTNMSVPLNYNAPWVGTTTGTGAALVVAVAGIPTGSEIRFYLVGGSIAAFNAGIAAPSAISVQPNVSFTYTGTTGAIYGYEVMFA
jgi:hypothetical protein